MKCAYCNNKTMNDTGFCCPECQRKHFQAMEDENKLRVSDEYADLVADRVLEGDDFDEILDELSTKVAEIISGRFEAEGMNDET